MSLSNQPDRFGCSTIVFTLLGALALLAALLILLAAGVINLGRSGQLNPGNFGQNNAPNVGNGANNAPGGGPGNPGGGANAPGGGANQGPAGGGNAAGGGAGNAGGGTGGGPGTIPAISNRTFISGSVTVTVTGAFTVDATLPLDIEKSYVDDNAWLAYDDGTTQTLITFNEPENAITVARGTTSATAQDDACTWDVHVTSGLVSGHVSCPEAPLMVGTEPSGTVRIEADFTANS